MEDSEYLPAGFNSDNVYLFFVSFFLLISIFNNKGIDAFHGGNFLFVFSRKIHYLCKEVLFIYEDMIEIGLSYSSLLKVTGFGIVEMEKIIKKLMIEWFDANGIDFREFFDDTTSHCEWMVRNIPDTYPYLFHNLLIDIAIEQNIIKKRVE